MRSDSRMLLVFEFIFMLYCFKLALSAFPTENQEIYASNSMENRYRALLPLLDSATFVAEQYMWFAHQKPRGFFNIMGGIWSEPDEVKYYYRLANLPNVNVICDVGFNAGHSAITFLTANPNVTVISFDIAKLPWTMNSVQYVSWMFGKRFKFIKGPSTTTMQEAAKNKTMMNGLKCDLVSVDGDHTLAWEDIWHGYFISRHFAYVVADDYATLMGKVVYGWQKAVKKQVIKEIDCHKDVAVGRGWCLGMYNNDDVN